MQNNYMDSHVYRFLTACSRERNPYALCSTIVKEIERLIPFDQARILFINENGKIESSVLYGVEKRIGNVFWITMKASLTEAGFP